MKCKKCDIKHDGSFGSGVFCSRSCANSRVRTKEIKDKISKSVKKFAKDNPDKLSNIKGSIKGNRVKRIELVCEKPSCDNIFIKRITSTKRFCCNACSNYNSGGLRQGSGRGKSGWYKGYYCDSSWELAFVMYNLDHNIEFQRNTEKFSYIFENKKRQYIPDFIIDNIYIEIKGYVTKQWESKLEQFEKPIKVIYKKDIQKYLDYTIDKYGNDYINLYE